MANALIHTLFQALEALEDRHDKRTADRVVQRIRLLPEAYQHICPKFEDALQKGYPPYATDALIDEIEHILHELKSTKEQQPNFVSSKAASNTHSVKNEKQYSKDKKAFTFAKNNAPGKGDFTVKEHPLIKKYGNEIPEGVAFIPYFKRRARHPHQKVMHRAQEKTKTEKRIETFNKAVSITSKAKRLKDAKEYTLKPAIDLNLWLRPEYIPTEKFRNDAEFEKDIEKAIYLDFTDAEQHFSTESLGSETLQSLKEEGLVYFFHAQQWQRIQKQPLHFSIEEKKA